MALLRRFEVKAILFLGLALLSCGAECIRVGLAVNGATVFDVTKFGAKADARTECAQAFIRAWNAACQSNGPAKVLIPEGKYLSGEVFFHGPCKSPMTVEVQGTILAQPDVSEFANGQWFTIQNVAGLTITGKGIFNGQGESSWQYNSCGGQAVCESPLPPTMVLQKVSNTLVEGVTLVNSKGLQVKITDSRNVTFKNVNITAPKNSPNTDGITISQSDHINVLKSTISSGGSCIFKGAGAAMVSVSAVNCAA